MRGSVRAAQYRTGIVAGYDDMPSRHFPVCRRLRDISYMVTGKC
jgi:hypothetical protein